MTVRNPPDQVVALVCFACARNCWIVASLVTMAINAHEKRGDQWSSEPRQLRPNRATTGRKGGVCLGDRGEDRRSAVLSSVH